MYGARNVSNTPGFSWSGLPGTTKYEFILARDAALQQVVIKAEVPLTSYIYDGKLDSNTMYYWQVRAIEPVVSDPSPVGSFTVAAEKKPVTAEVPTQAPIPVWTWWIIAVFTVLVASIIAFTMVKPSYVRPGRGKLFKVEPIVEKPKNPTADKPKNPAFDGIKNTFIRFWRSITVAIKKVRFSRTKVDSPTEESKTGDSQSKSA
jgi:hypothetical protein